MLQPNTTYYFFVTGYNERYNFGPTLSGVAVTNASTATPIPTPIPATTITIGSSTGSTTSSTLSTTATSGLPQSTTMTSSVSTIATSQFDQTTTGRPTDDGTTNTHWYWYAIPIAVVVVLVLSGIVCYKVLYKTRLYLEPELAGWNYKYHKANSKEIELDTLPNSFDSTESSSSLSDPLITALLSHSSEDSPPSSVSETNIPIPTNPLPQFSLPAEPLSLPSKTNAPLPLSPALPSPVLALSPPRPPSPGALLLSPPLSSQKENKEDSDNTSLLHLVSPATFITGNNRTKGYTARRAKIVEELAARLKYSSPAPLLQYKDLIFKSKVGEGSSGKVYKGLYKDTIVAIKVLKKVDKNQEESIRAFVKEFEIMSAIRTPHSVRFYGAVLDQKICMVMEYCSRETLYHVLKNPYYNVEWDQLFHYAIEITNGIKELHCMNPQVIHRDVKSLNFLVNENFDVKVCDFGLSRFNTGSNLSTLQQLRGTYAYCAPEVYNLQLFSTKSDVYSIGIVFWELVTRCIFGQYESPYSEYGFILDIQIIIQVAKSGLRPTIPPTCPEGFKQLILSCVEAEPENRPNCDMILKTLKGLNSEYLQHDQEWKAAKVPKTEQV